MYAFPLVYVPDQTPFIRLPDGRELAMVTLSGHWVGQEPSSQEWAQRIAICLNLLVDIPTDRLGAVVIYADAATEALSPRGLGNADPLDEIENLLNGKAVPIDAEAEFGVPMGSHVDLAAAEAVLDGKLPVEQVPDADGWSTWNGESVWPSAIAPANSLNAGPWVEVRFRNGKLSVDKAGLYVWKWHGEGGPSDIVAWRFAKKVSPEIGHIRLSTISSEPALSIPAGVETRKLLVLSTGHLTEQTAGWLDTHDPRTEWPGCGGHYGPHGWFFYASAVNSSEGPRRIQDDLFAVMTYARSLGCDNVLFDQDADRLDALPSWEW